MRDDHWAVRTVRRKVRPANGRRSFTVGPRPVTMEKPTTVVTCSLTDRAGAVHGTVYTNTTRYGSTVVVEVYSFHKANTR